MALRADPRSFRNNRSFSGVSSPLERIEAMEHSLRRVLMTLMSLLSCVNVEKSVIKQFAGWGVLYRSSGFGVAAKTGC